MTSCVFDDGTEGDDRIAGRDERPAGRVETLAQRNDAQAEAFLRFNHRRADSLERVCRRLGESEQRPGFGRKAQREETAGVECRARIRRGRMCGGRECRAIGEVLLDLGSKHRIELAQNDSDRGVEHASAQSDHEVERVVARKREERGRFVDPGCFQCFVRARRNRPHDAHFVPRCPSEFRVNAFRQGVAANDQDQRP
jgi:hypothetical protein